MPSALFFLLLLCSSTYAAEVAITLDDPTTIETPLLSSEQRDQRIRETLRKEKITATLFVCGMRIDSPTGMKLLDDWDREGHTIANHTYSHKNFNSKQQTFESFSQDTIRGETVISRLRNFKKFLRFPMLKEGDTAGKRDEMRAFMKEHGYLQGYVTIDASDWYIDDRLITRLKENPKADLSGYKKFYLDHLWDRAQYYDRLAQKTLGRQIRHTLLIHHSLLNALFLKDVLAMFRQRGWKIIDSSLAYKDPLFKSEPRIAPAGESIVWGVAKESGKFESELRYPGEDGEYEKDKMDSLGL